MSISQPLSVEDYPFVQEFVTDSRGQIQKVVLTLNDYQRLLDVLADEDLYQAMNAVRDEIPLSREDALQLLEAEDA